MSATSGVRLKEGGHINRSLLTLSTVIGKLSQLPCNGHVTSNHSTNTAHTTPTPAPPPHIPYRDSTLTRILEPALGGNSRTAIIACITEVDSDTHTPPSNTTASHRMTPTHRLGRRTHLSMSDVYSPVVFVLICRASVFIAR